MNTIRSWFQRFGVLDRVQLVQDAPQPRMTVDVQSVRLRVWQAPVAEGRAAALTVDHWARRFGGNGQVRTSERLEQRDRLRRSGPLSVASSFYPTAAANCAYRSPGSACWSSHVIAIGFSPTWSR